MLQKILASAGIDPRNCAELLGFNPQIFAQWTSGQSRIPESVVPLLSAVLSVSPSVLMASPKTGRNVEEPDLVPQIWYKFRGPQLTESDREYVILVRQVGHFLNELEEVTRQKSTQWKSLFETIRTTVDIQAPPAEQGKAAARILRVSTSLGHGATGCGDVLRGMLRSWGILIMETPLPESRIEGCSFYVGSANAIRPCAFANTHHTTWFRRNAILMHELGHAIFEPFTGATLDLIAPDPPDEAVELRAQAFAQEALIPKDVLLHAAQSIGVKWANVSEKTLAQLVANTHVEQRMVTAAAGDAEFISLDQKNELNRMDISSALKQFSDHALTTEEYLHKTGEDSADWIGKRTTTLSPKSLRLPIGYINSVVDAYKNRQISPAKAAEYLIIEEHEFFNRFGDIYANAEI